MYKLPEHRHNLSPSHKQIEAAQDISNPSPWEAKQKSKNLDSTERKKRTHRTARNEIRTPNRTPLQTPDARSKSPYPGHRSSCSRTPSSHRYNGGTPSVYARCGRVPMSRRVVPRELGQKNRRRSSCWWLRA